jgi:GcrA cell cycle regulator
MSRTSGNGHPTWPEEQQTLLIQLWNDKVPAHLIALQIQQTFGQAYTRNAIIGKACRMGLRKRGRDHAPVQSNSIVPKNETTKGKPCPTRRRPFTPPKTPLKINSQNGVIAPAPSQPMRPEPKPEAPTAPPCSFWELTRTRCRWPLGTELPFEFCGAETMRGESYCPHHCTKAYWGRQQ